MTIDLRALEKRERWVTALRGQLLVYGIRPPALVEEYRFMPDRMFRFDFALPGQKIGIEVEGGVFTRSRPAGDLAVVGGKLTKLPSKGSRHTSGQGYTADCEKYNLAALAGWMVLRFTSPMIESTAAVKTVLQAVKARTGDAQR